MAHNRKPGRQDRVRCECLGISLEEQQTNEEIRKQAQVMPIQDLMRKRRLQWVGHVLERRRGGHKERLGDARESRRKEKESSTAGKRNMVLCGLEKKDIDNLDRWRCLVERKIRQKPTTRN